jgi:peroxiredoxin
VGWPTLLRNGLLAVIAGAVVWHGPHDVGPSVVHWLSALTPAQLGGVAVGGVGLGLLAAQSWFLLHLLHQHGRLLRRMDTLEAQLSAGGLAPVPASPAARPGLPIGAPAPSFRLTGLYGETLTLEALRAPGQPVLLIFTDSQCGSCTALLPEVGRWQREHAAQLTLVLISRGTVEANQAKTAVHGATHVLLQHDQEVTAAYQVSGTPTAVLVRPNGTIGSPLATGAEAIRALVAHVVSQTPGQPAPLPMPILAVNGVHGRCPHCGQVHGDVQYRSDAAPAQPHVPAIPLGAPAPALRLPDLHGQLLDLTAFRGRPTLVLFWNPACGYCQQMLPDLKSWESDPPVGSPQLLVVSSGTTETNHAMGLRSPIFLDESFTAGRIFGATGTPSALLLDAQGHIASPIIIGASAVLALLAGSDARLHPPARSTLLATGAHSNGI